MTRTCQANFLLKTASHLVPNGLVFRPQWHCYIHICEEAKSYTVLSHHSQLSDLCWLSFATLKQFQAALQPFQHVVTFISRWLHRQLRNCATAQLRNPISNPKRRRHIVTELAPAIGYRLSVIGYRFETFSFNHIVGHPLIPPI